MCAEMLQSRQLLFSHWAHGCSPQGTLAGPQGLQMRGLPCSLCPADEAVRVEKERPGLWFFQAGIMKTKARLQGWEEIARRG